MTCLTSDSQQHVFIIKVIVLNFSAAFPSGTLSNNFHLLSNHSNNCHIKKLLWEIIGKTLSDINCTNVFLGQTRKVIEMKISKWDPIKLKSFYTAKETIKTKQNKIKPKRQPTKWKKIFANKATDKGLISKMKKVLKFFNNKKLNLKMDRRP